MTHTANNDAPTPEQWAEFHRRMENAGHVRSLADILTGADHEQRCPDCHHIHTPDGCTGPPSPSDLWAGVSVEDCDCIPFDALGRDTPPEVSAT